MGNEGSKLKGLIIDKTAVEANDFWTLYNAECPNSANDDGRQLLSIFQGEPIVKGQLWVAQGPMERAIKNLMIYRHPYILKYVTTWEEGGQKHLATERVRPLSDVLATQSDIQVCLGLRTILCSLIFLVEKALARHLNICTQSIYVNDNNGSWRLAGFEYVWKAKDVNQQLLELAHSFRYQSAIDAADREQLDSIEQFAFATFCEQILERFTKAECSTPHFQEFRAYCGTHLKHNNPQLRPKLSAVLLHPYFNHEFVLIHSFLFELPLKSVQERQQFFTSLIDRLRYFDEQVVASQLAANLLSRMVLLDATAQLCVTPYVLRTKSENSSALFSQQTYNDFLLPKILKMFRLRDAQIRLILLEYFMEYVRLLSEAQLKIDILPHLLIGMQDTNDVLVAKTLRCMADLVPILGAAAVLSTNGVQHTRRFADGRPHAAVSTDTNAHWVEPRSITPVINGGGNAIDDFMVSSSPLPLEPDLNGSCISLPQIEDQSESISLPLRLSPDGGEDNKSATIVDCTLNGSQQNISSETMNATNETSSHAAYEDEAWSDWETSDELQRLSEPHNAAEDAHIVDLALTPNASDLLLLNKLETNSSSSQTTQTDSFRTAYSTLSTATTIMATMKPIAKQHAAKIDDLNGLDIQVQVSNSTRNNVQATEYDYFKDMEPVFVSEQQSVPSFASNAPPAAAEEVIHIDASRFAPQSLNLDLEQSDGWGVDEDDDTAAWANT